MKRVVRSLVMAATITMVAFGVARSEAQASSVFACSFQYDPIHPGPPQEDRWDMTCSNEDCEDAYWACYWFCNSRYQFGGWMSYWECEDDPETVAVCGCTPNIIGD